MSDHFTFMIIPNRKSGVKKISVSKTFVRNLLIIFILIILVTLYVVYDYASIKRDRAELARLRQQTKEQSQQFRELAVKIETFAERMEELRQVDKKLESWHMKQIGRKIPIL